MKKSAGDIIILHMCTKNQNHMKYGSWDLEWDRQNFLSFKFIFCPFTPLPPWRIKIKKKKKKKILDVIILYRCTINENHMMCGSWDMEHKRFFFSFWAIF